MYQELGHPFTSSILIFGCHETNSMTPTSGCPVTYPGRFRIPRSTETRPDLSKMTPTCRDLRLFTSVESVVATFAPMPRASEAISSSTLAPPQGTLSNVCPSSSATRATLDFEDCLVASFSSSSMTHSGRTGSNLPIASVMSSNHLVGLSDTAIRKLLSKITGFGRRRFPPEGSNPLKRSSARRMEGFGPISGRPNR